MAGRDFNPTPGEWEFVPGEPGFVGFVGLIIVKFDEAPVATLAELRDPHYFVSPPDPGLGDEESNGRLMAASKDLLEVAELAMGWFDSLGLVDLKVYVALRDAVTKARSRS